MLVPSRLTIGLILHRRSNMNTISNSRRHYRPLDFLAISVVEFLGLRPFVFPFGSWTPIHGPFRGCFFRSMPYRAVIPTSVPLSRLINGGTCNDACITQYMVLHLPNFQRPSVHMVRVILSVIEHCVIWFVLSASDRFFNASAI